MKTAKFNPKNIESGVVVCGHRHPHCIQTMKALTGLRTVTYAIDGTGRFKQGFLTNQNRFVDREEGAKIALESKQIEKPLKRLFSEDLY